MEDCCQVDLPYPAHTFGIFQDNHSSIFGELPVQLGWVEVLKATRHIAAFFGGCGGSHLFAVTASDNRCPKSCGRQSCHHPEKGHTMPQSINTQLRLDYLTPSKMMNHQTLSHDCRREVVLSK
jgi:hypothetical protein